MTIDQCRQWPLYSLKMIITMFIGAMIESTKERRERAIYILENFLIFLILGT